jgi:hypothetical protein
MPEILGFLRRFRAVILFRAAITVKISKDGPVPRR